MKKLFFTALLLACSGFSFAEDIHGQLLTIGTVITGATSEANDKNPQPVLIELDNGLKLIGSAAFHRTRYQVRGEWFTFAGGKYPSRTKGVIVGEDHVIGVRPGKKNVLAPGSKVFYLSYEDGQE